MTKATTNNTNSRQRPTTGALTRTLRTAALGAACLLMLGGAAVPSGALAARPAADKTPPSKIVGAAEQRQAKAFPIDEIVRQARPLPMPEAKSALPGEGSQRADGPQLDVQGAAPAPTAGQAPLAGTDVAQNGLWTGAYNSNPNRQVGKLYFDIKKGPGVVWKHCSATAVNSENKSVVVTAGHCVFNNDPTENGYVEGDRYWYENVQFCPGYEYECKLGVWHARQMFTTNSWFDGSGTARVMTYKDDMAIVLVSRHATKGLLVSAVGGHGISFNQATGLYRHAFGYPVADTRWPAYSYNGEDLIYCPGRDAYDDRGHVVIYCTMTGGASGGPWIINPASNWMGTVNSVNSHKSTPETMSGPYFGNAESSLYQYARDR